MGSHATGHPYYANGTALYNDTKWMASFINAALAPTAQLTQAQRAWMIIHSTRLQVSGDTLRGGSRSGARS